MAAQDAELRLKVGLDLAFFRQQLSGLGAAAAGYNLPLNVSFNREKIRKELANLRSAINRSTYRIEIGGNIDSLPDKIKTLKSQLESLESFKIDLGVGAVKSLSKRDAAAIKRELRATLLGNEKKIYVGASIKPQISRKDVRDFQNAVQSKLSGITVKVNADLRASSISGGAKSQTDIDNDVRRGLQAISEMGAARMAGGGAGVTEAARREQLKQSLSQGGFDIAGLKAIGSQLGVSGVGRFRNVNNLIEKIVADASIEMIKKYLDPQAVMKNPDRSGLKRVLDTFARGLFNMLGMDATAIARAQRPPIGPSSTGRMLPGAPTPFGLPGTAFGQQKYLPTALGEELKQVLRNAANAFVDTLKKNIRTVDVRDLGPSLSRQGLLRGGSIAGMLPPAVGRTPSPYSAGAIGGESRAELLARREREARMRSALREMDVMGGGAGRPASPYSYAYRGARPRNAMVPYGPGGAIVPAGGGLPPSGPPPSGTGMPGGMGGGGGGSFVRAMGNVRLPGTGVIRELAGEFGEATKQVLLFGTAYKALAFATSFPAQVGQAVGALQSFNNTLKAISPTANEARASNELILSLVERYNIPLQSARDGFTKLYASMQPAGFSGEEVRNMFVGISKAAAAFGMSADKVDRVNYAFAQMASKGQVMSEELKGQLGDVLPGAMAIFAEAAGFKGPDAIQKFSAALEAGAYKGNAMKVLLMNVGATMNKEFGPGAEGAARTFQGAINRMQNSLTLLYETFEPVALGFLNAVVVPMTNGIREISDGFNAFFKDTAAKTSGGFAIAQELEKLKPSFDGIIKNLKDLIPSFQVFGNILLQVAKALTVIAGNPITGFLLKMYVNVLLVNTAFNLLGGRILITLISSIGASISRFIAMNFAMATLQRTTATANSALAGTQLQMALLTRNAGSALGPVGMLVNSLRALASFGLITIGINVVISGLAEIDRLNKSLEQIGSYSSKAYRQELTGQAKENINSQLIANRATQKAIEKELKQYEGPMGAAKGLITGRDEELRRRLLMVQSKEQELIKANRTALPQAQIQQQTTGNLPPVPEAPPSGKDAEAAAGRAAKTAEQLAQEQYKYEADLIRRNGDQVIALDNLAFDHWKTLQEQKYSLAEAGQNEWMQREVKFQRDLQAIEIERIETIRRAQQEAQKATVQAQAAAVEAQASPMGAVGGGAGGAYLQGNIGPTSTGPHFDVKKVGGGYFPRNYLDPYVDVNGRPLSAGTTVGGGTFAAHQARGSHGWDYAFGEGRYAATLKGGAQWMEGAPTAHGERRRFKIPTGEVFQFLHGTGEGIGTATPGSQVRAERDANDARLAVLEAAQAKEQEILLTKYAQEVAQGKNNLLIKEYVASLVPVEQQKLENALLVERNRLLSTGLSGNILEAEMTMFEATERLNLARKEANAVIEQNNKLLADGSMKAEDATRLNAIQTERVNQLADATTKYLPLLKEKTVLEMQGEFNRSRQALDQRAQILSMPLGMERLGELRQQFPGRNDYAQQLYEIENRLNAIENLRNSLKDVAGGIGQAFGQATKDVLTSSNSIQQTLANLFQSIADSFASMVASMIAEWVKAQVIKGFQSIFNLVPGGAAPSIPIPGSTLELAANGAVWQGGFTAFANGGMVTGPTLGLVGEGRYNEAIVPLPDGKSIPVELGGNAGGSTSVIVNVDAKGTSAQGNESAAKELGIVISAAVQQELVKQRRPGGILSK